MALRRFAILCALACALACKGPLLAQVMIPTPLTDAERTSLTYTLAHYTKYEYRIPMRDGVRLFAAVYVPKDAASHPYPMIMQRTPYNVGPYGADNYKTQVGPSFAAEKEGFIFVYEDVRGRYMSEGVFVDVRPHKAHYDGPKDTDDSTDTYDTIDWLVKHVPNNNGKVGMWGISYPGFFAAHGLMDAHPALKAVSPQAPMGDVGNGDDGYHNGAFHLAANFRFYSSFLPRKPDPERPVPGVRFDPGTMDAYDFFLRMGSVSNANEKYLKHTNVYWDDTILHTSYDEYWQTRAQAPHMKNITPAVMWVGGWFDAEDLSGPLKLFNALEKNGAMAPDTLVMGPWRHGGWARDKGDTLGNLNFKTNTSEFFQENIELPFFVQNLKGQGNGLKATAESAVPKAYLFETGRNEWRRFDAWPPAAAAARTLVLRCRRKAFMERSSGHRLRRVSERPEQAGALDRRARAGLGDACGLHDLRSALRRHAPRCADLRDRTARPRCNDRRTDHAAAARLHHRHGFGFCGEADRCVSERLSGSGSERERRVHGRLPTAGAW